MDIDSFRISDFELHGKGSHFFLVGCNEVKRALYIAFKGTQTGEDILTDGKVYSTFAERGLVHSGFMERAKCIPQDFFIEKLNEGWHLTVTGFSLGAAVAVLFTSLLLSNPKARRNTYLENNLLLCVTFGCPLVGDEDFCKQYQGEEMRIFHFFVNEHDAVVRLCLLAHKFYQGNMLGKIAQCISPGEGLRVLRLVFNLGADWVRHKVPAYVPFGVHHFINVDEQTITTEEDPTKILQHHSLASLEVKVKHIQQHLAYYPNLKSLIKQGVEYGGKKPSFNNRLMDPIITRTTYATEGRVIRAKIEGHYLDCFTRIKLTNTKLEAREEQDSEMKIVERSRTHMTITFTPPPDLRELVLRFATHFEHCNPKLSLPVVPSICSLQERVAFLPVVTLLQIAFARGVLQAEYYDPKAQGAQANKDQADPFQILCDLSRATAGTRVLPAIKKKGWVSPQIVSRLEAAKFYASIPEDFTLEKVATAFLTAEGERLRKHELQEYSDLGKKLLQTLISENLIPAPAGMSTAFFSMY